jgi:hypothetical protein
VQVELPREASTVSGRLATLNFLLKFALLILVLFFTFVDATYYLRLQKPNVLIQGWIEQNSLYTGVDPKSGIRQTYTDINGKSRPFDVHSPHYCQSPYTNDYTYSATWVYDNIRCARLPWSDMWSKEMMPSGMFINTFFQTYSHEQRRCSDNVTTCNRTSPGVTLVGDSCTCEQFNNYYTVNPEGMKLMLFHTFNVEDGPDTYEGGSLATEDGWLSNTPNIGVATKVKYASGMDYKTFETGEPICLTVGELLELAGDSLDVKAPPNVNAKCGESFSTQADAKRPYNRLTGTTLEIDVRYSNVDNDKDFPFSMFRSEVEATLTVRAPRSAGWTSTGFQRHTALEKESKKQSRYNNNVAVDIFDGVTSTKYVQGVHVVFKPYGEMGFWDGQTIFNALIQFIVLMSLSNQILRYVVRYAPLIPVDKCLPPRLLRDFRIFSRALFKDVDINRVMTQSTALQALHAAQVHKVFDPQDTGHPTASALYDAVRPTLKMHGLDDDHIAAAVHEVMKSCMPEDTDYGGFTKTSDAEAAVDRVSVDLSEGGDGKPSFEKLFNLLESNQVSPEEISAFYKYVEPDKAHLNTINEESAMLAEVKKNRQKSKLADEWKDELKDMQAHGVVSDARDDTGTDEDSLSAVGANPDRRSCC